MEATETNYAIAADVMASLNFASTGDNAEAGTVLEFNFVECENGDDFDPAFRNHCTQATPFAALSCNESMGAELAHECCDALNGANQASACRYLLEMLNNLSGYGEITKAIRRGAAAVALVVVLIFGIPEVKARSNSFRPRPPENKPTIPSKSHVRPTGNLFSDPLTPVKKWVIRGTRFDSDAASALASRHLGRISWTLAFCLFIADVVIVTVARML